MSLQPYWEREGVTLYCGDCLEILPELDVTVDAVVTDPPYGVEFSGKAGHYRNEPNAKRADTYASYSDTEEQWARTVLPAVRWSIANARSAAVFMAGKMVQKLPAGDLGGIYLPNGCGRTAWGFQCFMHVVFYGKDPYLAAGRGCLPNGRYGCYGNDANQQEHPCAKPIRAMLWAVNRVSLDGELVLDPFMGSGTTGVACVQTGRRFIGIELEERYCEIAVRRIEKALAQLRLDLEMPAARPEPMPCLLEV